MSLYSKKSKVSNLTGKQSEYSFFQDMFSDYNASSNKDYKHNINKKGTFVGTRDYISPEMVSDNVSGPFTDIWALGIIVFELYTGRRPWKGKDELGIFDQIQSPDKSVHFTIEIPEDA